MNAGPMTDAFKGSRSQPAPFKKVQPYVEGMGYPLPSQLGKSGQCSPSIGADEDGVEPVRLRPGDALMFCQVVSALRARTELDENLLGRIVRTKPDCKNLDDGLAADAYI